MSLINKESVTNNYSWFSKDMLCCSLSILKQTFAAFVDVYHTSTVGVFDRPLGNADIWINGGQTQPNGIKPGAHQAAPTFYVKSIATPSGSCQFKAWHCEDSDWQPFHNDKRDKEDTCNYAYDFRV